MASGRLAISLSVAKMTWMMKSVRSLKRTRMRPSPFFSRSNALRDIHDHAVDVAALEGGDLPGHGAHRLDVDAVAAPSPGGARFR